MIIELLVATAFAKVHCDEALMSSVVEGKKRVESTRLCVEDEQREGSRARVQAIASENCRDENSEKPCLAYTKAREAADYSKRLSGFELCLKMGGEPESIRFQMTALGVGAWHVTDRCRFDLDYSFLDTQSFSGKGPFKPN